MKPVMQAVSSSMTDRQKHQQVKAGDVLEIQFGSKSVRVEVLNVQETVKKEEAQELYRYLSRMRQDSCAANKKRKPSYNGCIDHCMEVFSWGR